MLRFFYFNYFNFNIIIKINCDIFNRVTITYFVIRLLLSETET